MSPELKAFYVWMQESIDGKNEHYPWCGLCFNVYNFAEQYYMHCSSYDLAQQLIAHFEAHALEPNHPFDQDYASYIYSKDNNSLYRNPQRLAWIKQHAEG